MTAYRRVDAGKAGPNALGILVPPGEQTQVVVRPRPLLWDLLPARWNGESTVPPSFCRFTRDEAASVARRLHLALEACAAAVSNPIETFGDASGRRFQVWLRVLEFFWILCSRAPGQAYCPAAFSSRAEAEQAAIRADAFLLPRSGNVSGDLLQHTVVCLSQTLSGEGFVRERATDHFVRPRSGMYPIPPAVPHPGTVPGSTVPRLVLSAFSATLSGFPGNGNRRGAREDEEGA